MTDTQQIKLSLGIIFGLIGGISLIFGWAYLAFNVLVPALWGPYAFAFSDAGTVAPSGIGFMFVFLVAPALAIAFPFRHAKTIFQWAALQFGTACLAVMVVVGFGFYIHNIVYMQGVDASLELFADEVGFKNAASVPANVKAAFALSDKLAKEGNAPWLPGAWKSVDWPTIPANQAH